MKRTYIKPQAQAVIVAESLLSGESWAVGNRMGDSQKLDIDDPVNDMGKVITDLELKKGDYDPWDSKNW